MSKSGKFQSNAQVSVTEKITLQKKFYFLIHLELGDFVGVTFTEISHRLRK